MPEVRGLSIRQPWCWLIAAGFKTPENRTWRTGFRGRLFEAPIPAVGRLGLWRVPEGVLTG
jgi:hypothetical protein